jgi:NAD(P)-dependent dehydrogenase (short-subunit alcohol dehydrogenase family)
MVERFAAEGATVHFADLNDTAAQEVLDAQPGGSLSYQRVDVADRQAAASWVDAVAEQRDPAQTADGTLHRGGRESDAKAIGKDR